MAQVKRGAGESLIPLFSHRTLHFGKVAIAMRQQPYLLLVVFQGGAMEFGNLMSYAPDLDDLFRHSTKNMSSLEVPILPDFRVEFPARYPLIFNLKTAKALDLTIHNHWSPAPTR